MAKEKEKPEEKTVTRTKKKTEEETPEGPRIIWLYGGHECIPREAVQKMVVDYASQDCIDLRKSLGLGLDDMLIPIYPYPANKRLQVLDSFEGQQDMTLLVLGLPTDKKNSSLHEYYKGAEVAWVDLPERQFHISMMRTSSSISYQEAKKQMEEWQEFFKDHFDEDSFHII